MSRRVLIVDDNDVNLKLAREIVTALGYDVVEASSGEEAIRQAQEHHPDLILLDIALPDIDGLVVLARLRKIPSTKAIPIVAMTAQAMVGDRQRFLDAGCDGYIAKPISVRTFALEIERYFAQGPQKATGA